MIKKLWKLGPRKCVYTSGITLIRKIVNYHAEFKVQTKIKRVKNDGRFSLE